MKRFISKKTIKVPRYKLLYFRIIIIITLVLILNFSLNFYLKNTNQNKLLSILNLNSFGNILPSFNLFDKTSLVFKNIYGLDYEPTQNVSSSPNNLTELVVKPPLVYIYNTFQTSKYKNNYYNSYNINPVITTVNLMLKEYLASYNISSLVELNSVAKTLKENNISYDLSYRGSRILLESAYSSNPSLNFFFDLAISSKTYNDTTTTINNKKYAKVLFVVGTENANYEMNKALATSLNNKLSSFNKDLTRGIDLRGGEGYHGVYNEDFNPHLLLIEIGGKENTIDEVSRTVKVLASVLNNFFKEEGYV